MSIKKPIRYAFLQIPNYSMVTFSSAVASLRGANYISKQDLYAWQVVSMDGVPVTASVGFEVTPTLHVNDLNLNDLEAVILRGYFYRSSLRQKYHYVFTQSREC